MEFSNLILDCRGLLNRDWEAHVEHIWREANSSVDLLAKRGAFQSKMGVCMIHAPLFCGNVYIGIPWVLSHPVVIVVNKGPTMFCLVIASPLFGFGLVDCVLVSCG